MRKDVLNEAFYLNVVGYKAKALFFTKNRF